eukprot:gene15408-21487_t
MGRLPSVLLPTATELLEIPRDGVEDDLKKTASAGLNHPATMATIIV